MSGSIIMIDVEAMESCEVLAEQISDSINQIRSLLSKYDNEDLQQSKYTAADILMFELLDMEKGDDWVQYLQESLDEISIVYGG